jgi:hypothetical protein
MKKVLSRAGVAAMTVVVGVMTMGVAAFATTTYDPADPTSGTAESTLTSIQNWVASHGAPLIAGLIFIGVAFILLLKFVRRGTRAA